MTGKCDSCTLGLRASSSADSIQVTQSGETNLTFLISVTEIAIGGSYLVKLETTVTREGETAIVLLEESINVAVE